MPCGQPPVVIPVPRRAPDVTCPMTLGTVPAGCRLLACPPSARRVRQAGRRHRRQDVDQRDLIVVAVPAAPLAVAAPTELGEVPVLHREAHPLQAGRAAGGAAGLEPALPDQSQRRIRVVPRESSAGAWHGCGHDHSPSLSATPSSPVSHRAWSSARDLATAVDQRGGTPGERSAPVRERRRPPGTRRPRPRPARRPPGSTASPGRGRSVPARGGGRSS